jgi:hypothetical protein
MGAVASKFAAGLQPCRIERIPRLRFLEDVRSRECRSEGAELGIRAFLTAYAPSDLPGGSIDPLGFERGYLFLADKILPGLTNAASRPRYFSMICTGIFLAPVEPGDPPRTQFVRRRDSVLRLECLWALANVLAAGDDRHETLPLSGIRGVICAQARASELLGKKADRTDSSYRMLAYTLFIACCPPASAAICRPFTFSAIGHIMLAMSFPGCSFHKQ